MNYQLECPNCRATVAVEQNSVEGTVQRGGHKTVGGVDFAKCPNPNCGRVFTEAEIDAWAQWLSGSAT
jgi:hypothetical protein